MENTDRRCKVLAIANQKGGVSKTTTAVNLGIGLVRAGKKVLLLDADAQGSLTASMGIREPDRLNETLASVMASVMEGQEVGAEYESSLMKKGSGSFRPISALRRWKSP